MSSESQSPFLIVTKLFITDSLVSFWKKIKLSLSVIKYYIVYGIFPTKKQHSFPQELAYSKIILEILFALLVVITFFITSQTDSLIEGIGSFLILIVYYIGVMLFVLLGKIVAAISCKERENKSSVEASILREFNFIFITYSLLLPFLVTKANDEKADIGNGVFYFVLFAMFHVFYAFAQYFFSKKTLKHFFGSLVVYEGIMLLFLFIATIFIATIYQQLISL
jgi:hypothetical protein